MAIAKPKGRPPHKPTDEQRRMVEAMAGFAIPEAKIALVIGVDDKTLRLHYATEIARGAATVEAKLAGNLLRLASGTDGTALKAIMFALTARFGWSQYAPPPVEKAEPLGKKAALEIEAEHGHKNTSWGALLN